MSEEDDVGQSLREMLGCWIELLVILGYILGFLVFFKIVDILL